jgi:RNA polymerase sigma-B factor
MKRVANATDYNSLDTKQLFGIYSNNRDIEIRNILIERHMYLANILSKKYMNKGVEFEDIYQVASLALIYAIDRYSPEKGYEFSSFATPTIMGEIKKYFRDKVWTLKVPRRIQELSKKVNEVKLELQQKIIERQSLRILQKY